MPDNTELNAYIQSEKVRFINKIKGHILRIETELNITFDHSITETDCLVLVNGVDNYSYRASKWFYSKIDSSVKLVFNSSSNPFMLPNTNKSLLSFSLNDDFELVTVNLRNWVQSADGRFTDVKLTFDSQLVLVLLEENSHAKSGLLESYAVEADLFKQRNAAPIKKTK